MRISRSAYRGKPGPFAGLFFCSTPLSTAVDSCLPTGQLRALSAAFPPCTGCGQPAAEAVRLYSDAQAGFPARCVFRGYEADLSAERAQTEAQARLPGANGHARRTPDPEAAPREGAQAPLGVVQRKHRLSRSRDFDAVYRHGRSVSTRFLTLYWFERPADEDDGEPRLGLAVPRAAGNAVVRNRIKRQLREVWRAKLEAGALPPRRDVVLVVRPGLPEAVEANGFGWLVERVDELLARIPA